MKIVSLITDSLAMPRVEGEEKIFIHQTWPKILAAHLGEDYILAEFKERARDTDSLQKDQLFFETITCCKPDIVIFEIGIVDCAPRIISKKENAFFNRRVFPTSLRNFIIRRRKKNRLSILRKGPLNKVYVAPENFRKNIQQFVQKIVQSNPRVSILLMPILGNFSVLDKKSPGYQANKDLYNKILKEISMELNCCYLEDLIDIMQDESNYTLDSYHLSSQGHEKMGKHLLIKINKELY